MIDGTPTGAWNAAAIVDVGHCIEVEREMFGAPEHYGDTGRGNICRAVVVEGTLVHATGYCSDTKASVSNSACVARAHASLRP